MPHLLGSLDYTWPYYAAALGGYLLGSIPFGLLLTHAAGLGDIRRIGSGNIGATNVLRTGNRWLAAATLLLDAGKGAAAVLIARHFWGPDMAIMAGGGAMIGHLFPVWLRFKALIGMFSTARWSAMKKASNLPASSFRMSCLIWAKLKLASGQAPG